MLTTVYFATNRALTGAPEDWRSYGAGIVAPSDPAAITYATAFVDNTNLTADKTGAITAIQNVQRGGFRPQSRTGSATATATRRCSMRRYWRRPTKSTTRSTSRSPAD